MTSRGEMPETPDHRIELVPSAELTALVAGLQPKPFYESVTFYGSLLALAMSGLALYLSYAASPLSAWSRPQLTYMTRSWTDPSKTDGMLTRFIETKVFNRSRVPAQDVVIGLISCGACTEPKVAVLDLAQHSLEKDGRIPAHRLVLHEVPALSAVRILMVVDIPKEVYYTVRNLGTGLELPAIYGVVSAYGPVRELDAPPEGRPLPE